MYKLELIWINTKENKFFEGSEAWDQDRAIEFNEYYLVKHKVIKPGTDPKDFPYEIYFDHQDDGSWKKVARIFGFSSPEHVKAYYLDGAKEKRFEYPETKRKWQQEHHIAAEVNILDENNNLVELLSSCHGNICVKFGTCDNNDSCDIKPGLPKLGSSGKFPIFHIKELNS